MHRKRSWTAVVAVAAIAFGTLGQGGAARAAGPVDLAKPLFSHPVPITNPLFFTSDLTQVVQLGDEAGEALRVEVTRLPTTKILELDGKRIETLQSQLVGFHGGRIGEVAIDYFAQADDGSVWYLGEAVDNYENGVVANHKGSWLAGRDGPPGMIMPGSPHAGDVYHSENIPGLVFEEDTVQATGLTVAGPRGPVSGAIRVQEKLMDGSLEYKVFAPGYAEFQADVPAAGEHIVTALAVPLDTVHTALPAELSTLTNGASRIFRLASLGNWTRAGAIRDKMTAAWHAYQARGGVPPLLNANVTDELDSLSAAVDARDATQVRQEAVNVGHASLDLHLRYRGVHDVDQDRRGFWRRQLLIDAAANDSAGVAGDRATIRTIRSRTAN